MGCLEDFGCCLQDPSLPAPPVVAPSALRAVCSPRRALFLVILALLLQFLRGLSFLWAAPLEDAAAPAAPAAAPFFALRSAAPSPSVPDTASPAQQDAQPASVPALVPEFPLEKAAPAPLNAPSSPLPLQASASAPVGQAVPDPLAPNGRDACGQPIPRSLDSLFSSYPSVSALAPKFLSWTDKEAEAYPYAPHFAVRRYALVASLPAFTAAAAAWASAAAPSGRPLRILLFSGSASFWGFDGNPKTAVFGEILQWSDLWTTLLHLNASVHFAYSERGCLKNSCGCHGDSAYALQHLEQYDAVFLDYLALKWLGDKGARPRLDKRRLFLLDSFGTSQEANEMPQDVGSKAGIGLYCCENLTLTHFLTLGPTSSNTFLGSMVFPALTARVEEEGVGEGAEDSSWEGAAADTSYSSSSTTPAADAASASAPTHTSTSQLPEQALDVLHTEPRLRLVLLHGKKCAFLPPPTHPLGAAMRKVLAAFSAAGFVLLDTMQWNACGAGHRPPGLVSLGVLGQGALRELQSRAHVLLGFGKPLLGAQALEALADGMLVLLPRYKVPRNCSNDEELGGKPVCETWTSQHPSMEGLQGVHVFDPFNKTAVNALVGRIGRTPFAELESMRGGGRPLPRGYSPPDFVESVVGLLAQLPPRALEPTPTALPKSGLAAEEAKSLVAELVKEAVADALAGLREQIREELMEALKGKECAGNSSAGQDGGLPGSKKGSGTTRTGSNAPAPVAKTVRGRGGESLRDSAQDTVVDSPKVTLFSRSSLEDSALAPSRSARSPPVRSSAGDSAAAAAAPGAKGTADSARAEGRVRKGKGRAEAPKKQAASEGAQLD